MNAQIGCQGGYLMKEPAKPKRIALLVVSRNLFEALCGNNLSAFLELHELSPHDTWKGKLKRAHKKIHKTLMLPDNSEVVAVSLSYLFRNNQVAMQVECPDFVETSEAFAMPQTDAYYYQTEDLLGKRVAHFDGWWGGTVPEYCKPEWVSADRCSEELGHFLAPNGDKCYCGLVVQDSDKEAGRVKKKFEERFTGPEKAAEVKSSNRGYEFL